MAVLISSHSAVGVPCVHCPTQGSCKVHTSEEEGGLHEASQLLGSVLELFLVVDGSQNKAAIAIWFLNLFYLFV